MAVWRQLWPQTQCARLSMSYGTRICTRQASTIQSHDPLRILFCGADEFSIASLEALHAERTRNENRIASIDVVCRPAKRVGRGLKSTREVPIAETARQLQLPLHQLDGFQGWEAPQPHDQAPNLIIAVSFGLFIPSKILGNAKYGGLNVHPSMLPDLHGPAPLHHTLLQRRSLTGVTVQTLHPKHFDRGTIVVQTPQPGIEHNCATVPQLRDLLAAHGARMLLECIADGSFISLPDQHTQLQAERRRVEGQPAPKITPKDCHVDWKKWTSAEIMLRHSIIGPLWSFVYASSSSGTVEKRVLWSAGFVPTDLTPDRSFRPGQPYISKTNTEHAQVYLNTVDERVFRLPGLTIDGQERKDPIRSAKKAGLMAEKAMTDSSGSPESHRHVQLFSGDII